MSKKMAAHYSLRPAYRKVESKGIQDRMHHLVNLAKALFSKGATSGGRTFNVTFACHKSKILAIGINDYKRVMHDYVRQLGAVYKVRGEKSYFPCMHGEISALLKLGLDDCSHLDFFNVRINKSKHCCNSMPCSNCYRMMKIVGFKHIYFYDDDMNICQIDD